MWIKFREELNTSRETVHQIFEAIEKIMANIYIFSIPFLLWWVPLWKQLEVFFFSPAQSDLLVCRIWSFKDTLNSFFLPINATIWQIYDGNIFTSIFGQFFTSQNWIWQIWIKIAQKLELYFSILLKSIIAMDSHIVQCGRAMIDILIAFIISHEAHV